MPVLKLVRVSNEETYNVPITNTTPPAGLFTRTDYSIEMPGGESKDFHAWASVQFPTGDYAGYATGFTNVLSYISTLEQYLTYTFPPVPVRLSTAK